MKKKICISNKIMMLTGVVFVIFILLSVLNIFSAKKTNLSTRAQMPNECTAKYGAGNATCMIGFGIGSYPGYLKGIPCSNGYCYYKDPNYVAPLTECQAKYGKEAICSIGTGLTFTGYLKGDSCSNGWGYCTYKDPRYVAPLTECQKKYGETAICSIGTGLTIAGNLKGDQCENGWGYCTYKDPNSSIDCPLKDGYTNSFCAFGGWGILYPGSVKGERCKLDKEDYYCFRSGMCSGTCPGINNATFMPGTCAPEGEKRCGCSIGKSFATWNSDTSCLAPIAVCNGTCEGINNIKFKSQECAPEGGKRCTCLPGKTQPIWNTDTTCPAPLNGIQTQTPTNKFYYGKIKRSLITNSGAKDLIGLTFTVTCMGHKGTRIYDINSYDGNYYYFNLAANSNSCTGLAECSVVGNPATEYLSKMSCDINKSVEFTTFRKE